MGAELGALGGIEGALEEGAEDGGFDGAAKSRRLASVRAAISSAVRSSTSTLAKRPPLKYGMLSRRRCRHRPWRRVVRGPGRRTGLDALAEVEDTGEDLVREEVDVFGEEAEEELHEVVGDGVRGVATGVQTEGDLAEFAGGFLGDGGNGEIGAEAGGIGENGAEDALGLGVGEGGEVEGIDLLDGICEVGVDLEAVEVADDEEGGFSRSSL
ncbi:MAG: hypothetical protein QM753_18460 [Thermomicrobiales bacterium]